MGWVAIGVEITVIKTSFLSSNLLLSFLALLDLICSYAFSISILVSIGFCSFSVAQHSFLAIFFVAMTIMFYSSPFDTTYFKPCSSSPSPATISSLVLGHGSGSTCYIAIQWVSPFCSSNTLGCSFAMMTIATSFLPSFFF
jgi:hypothetical protein